MFFCLKNWDRFSPLELLALLPSSRISQGTMTAAQKWRWPFPSASRDVTPDSAVEVDVWVQRFSTAFRANVLNDILLYWLPVNLIINISITLIHLIMNLYHSECSFLKSLIHHHGHVVCFGLIAVVRVEEPGKETIIYVWQVKIGCG